MFGLKKLLGLGGKNDSRKKTKSQAGVQLLGAMLVCYPEIGTVAFEPKDGQLVLGFVVREPLPGREELEKFAAFIDDSLQAYHQLEDALYVWTAISAEAQAGTLMLNVRRTLADVTRGELELIVTLMRDKYGEQLVVDKHSVDSLEPDFAVLQSDLLDQMLDQAQELAIKERIIGIRENDRVVVYNR